jgi:1,4-alpha-glucan branching enzyme
VVHGKRSMISKMPGDRWQQLANLRALYAFMWAHPGKKLLFMGNEFAQEQEWSEGRSLDWHLLENRAHSGIQSLVRDLNRAYRDTPALWERDYDHTAFWWLEPNDAENSVFAFARIGKDASKPAVFVANLTPGPRHGYRLGLPVPGRWTELVNTDSLLYGGSDIGNLGGVERAGRSRPERVANALVLARRLVAEALHLDQALQRAARPSKRPPGDCSPTPHGIRERDRASAAAMCEYQCEVNA